jgi:hypothetical protein
MGKKQILENARPTLKRSFRLRILHYRLVIVRLWRLYQQALGSTARNFKLQDAVSTFCAFEICGYCPDSCDQTR